MSMDKFEAASLLEGITELFEQFLRARSLEHSIPPVLERLLSMIHGEALLYGDVEESLDGDWKLTMRHLCSGSPGIQGDDLLRNAQTYLSLSIRVLQDGAILQEQVQCGDRLRILCLVPVLQGRLVRGLFALCLSPGDEDHLRYACQLLRSAAGALSILIERLRAEAALRNSEAEFRRIFDESPSGNFVSSVGGRILICNETFARMFGYHSSDDLLGRTAQDLFVDIEVRRHLLERLRRERKVQNFAIEMRRRNGTILHVSENVFGIFDDKGELVGLSGFLVDVSQQIEAERALRESEEKYRLLVETSPLPVGIFVDGVIVFANHLSAEFFGYHGLQGFLGVRVLDLVATEDRPMAMDYMRRRLAGDDSVPTHYNITLLHTDGRRIPAEMHVRAFMYEGRPAIQAIAFDKSEELLREEAMLQSAKMEAIGRLSGGVAHDFNNLLSVILSYVDLLQGTLQEHPEPLAMLEEVARAADRGAQLVRRLLAFSRKQPHDSRSVNLGNLLLDLERILRRLLGEDIILQLEIGGAPLFIWADPTQIEQVLMNLCVNARDAMPGGGTLRISARFHGAERAFRFGSDLLKAGEYVLLEVSDSGEGIEPEILPKIFDPFFTTKGPGRGSGLGLSTVYGVVRQTRGAIDVESTPRGGTTFRLIFPLGARSADSAEESSARRMRENREVSVLLAEDEDALRVALATYLRSKGCRVQLAANGIEALHLLDRPDCLMPDILITDIVMPQMDGITLSQAVEARHPGIPILFLTGYAEETHAERGVDLSNREVLLKPCMPSELHARVVEILEARRS